MNRSLRLDKELVHEIVLLTKPSGPVALKGSIVFVTGPAKIGQVS